MLYTIPFLLVLIIVSGFIAYWGDLLGRRMGKRRLTLFGMRPKYTAIVVTTITGMVIAALTLATMIGASSLFRKLITEGPRMIREQRILRKRNADLRAQRSRLSESTQRAIETANTATRRADRLNREARDRLEQLADVETELSSTTAQLNKEKKNLKSTQGNLRQAQRTYRQAQLTYMAAEAAAERQIREKYWQVRSLETAYVEKLKNPSVVGRGEEIIRKVVLPSPRARQDVIAVLTAASDIVEERGAAKGKNGRAVKILTKQVPYTDPSTGKTRRKLVGEEQSIRDIHAAISDSPVDVVVVVNAVQNSVKGEQAVVEVTLFNNNLAFSKGQEIAGAVMDGSRPQGQLLIDIIAFLRQDVRRAAEKANIIPAYNPADPEAVFGSITEPQEWTEVLDAISRIKAANRTVEVRLVARQDIYSVGPIDLSNLEFVVGSAGVSARGLD